MKTITFEMPENFAEKVAELALKEGLALRYAAGTIKCIRESNVRTFPRASYPGNPHQPPPDSAA